MAQLRSTTVNGTLTVTSTLEVNDVSCSSLETTTATIATLGTTTVTAENITATGTITGNVAGNITGNITGTAPRLETARTIGITDADSSNAGTSVSFDGSADVTLKLPSTIKADIEGDITASTVEATTVEAGAIDVAGNVNVLGTITGELNGSATRLSNTSEIGGAANPVYFNSSGVPVACTHTLETNVPSNAVFTDTKDTTGSSVNTSDTLYLVGAASRSSSGVVTYTRNSVYMDTTGKLHATSFESSSSRKVKENIKPAEINAVDLINTVNVVNFNFKDDEDKALKIGFIAEDTDSLLSTPSKDKMDYLNCIGVLLKAVQELSKKVEELEKLH